jgi:hypothetical protein
LRIAHGDTYKCAKLYKPIVRAQRKFRISSFTLNIF